MKRSSGFAKVPAEVLDIGNGYAIAVYAAIAHHADRDGVAFPSVKRLSEITGWSRPTIDKAIAMLVTEGVLVKLRRTENGVNISNQYRLVSKKTPKRQMETSLPTQETSLPTQAISVQGVRNDVSEGTQPRFQEQDPENKNHEQDASLRILKGEGRSKPAVNGDTPAHQLVNAYYEIVGGMPTNHGKDLGHAKTLLKAGVNVDNLRAFITWLRTNWRSKNGFDLTTAVNAVNEWQSTLSAPTPKKRLVV